MKKVISIVLTLAAFGFILAACSEPVNSDIDTSFSSITDLPYSGLAPLSGIDPEDSEYQEKLEELGIVQVFWNSDADKTFALDIDAVQNTTRKDASGIKISSNAHSDDFPGIYFIWDSKQKDSGYLKVSAPVFRFFESFTLTAKQANIFWDFIIAPVKDQQLTQDNCYVFFIPKVCDSKNINMVFLSGWVEREVEEEAEEPEIPKEPEQPVGIHFIVTNTAEWNDALAFIKNGGNGKIYTITIKGDVPVPGTTVNSFGNVSDITVTLNGDGSLYLLNMGSIVRSGAYQTVYINSEKLELKGINQSNGGNNTSVVYIVTGGILELQNGTIGDNHGTGVSAIGGSFIMSGGAIIGNTSDFAGGGICVREGGSFIMSEGTIAGNYARGAGGGVCVINGSFTMSGGSIFGNDAGGSGGGAYVSDGSFTMSGGSIIDNNHSSGIPRSISFSNCTINITGGTIIPPI